MILKKAGYIILIMTLLFVSTALKLHGATDPNADFSVDNANPVVNQTITFSDESDPNDRTIIAWDWNFGSGAIPTDAEGTGPHSVKYSTIGQKTVTLTVSYNVLFGTETNTETKTNYINVQDENSNTTPGTTYVPIPACATGVIVQAWGAGGGGTLANPDDGAGGGGGGAYTRGTITGLIPGNTITVTVGAGGAAGAGGGYSRVTYGSNTITANGGSSSTNSTNGGSGGAAQTIGGIITASYAGGNGGNGATTGNPSGGGGGSSASSTFRGTNGGNGANNTTGGLGGVAVGDGGNGGTGGDSDNNPAPQNGYLPGGGGGGRGKYNNNNGIISANGANGQVIYEWIYTNITPSVSIAITSGSNPSCSGTSVTFTATPTNGGATPTYQWYEGINPISGATNSTYTSSTLITGNTITCVMTSSSSCASPSNATSNSITMTVNPTVGTPTAITVSAGSEPTCQLTNGTTTTTYATTATYNSGFTWSLSNPAAGSINATTGEMTWANGFSGSVDIQVTANGCNGPSTQVTRTVNITSTVGTPTAITVSAGSEPTCQLTNGTTTTTYATTATNNSGFTWSLSNPAAGSINATTGEMTWANGFSGSVDIRVTANGCNGPSTQVTRTVTIVPQPTAPPITRNPDVNNVCAGQTLTVTTSAGSGGTGTIADQYRYSTDNGNNWSTWSTSVPNFAAVVGTNIIQSRRTADGTGCSTSASNQVSWNVVAQPTAPPITRNPDVNNICAGQTLTATTSAGSGGTGTIADEYRYSTDNGNNWSAWSSSVPSFSAVTGTNLIESRRTADGTGCSTSSSNQVSWNVVAQPTAPPITRNPDINNVCAGQTLTATTSAGSGGTGTIADEYRYSIDNGNNWSAWSTSVPNFAAVVGTNIIQSRRTADGTGCSTSASNQVSWNVGAIPSPPTTTGGQICIGSSATLSASGAVAGQFYRWYSSSSGGTLLKTSANNTDNTYTTPTISSTTNYWVAIMSNVGCESARTQVTATFPAPSPDNQNLAGNNTWVGHIYDGTNFNTYYGTYSEAETFNQNFGGDNNCFSINSSLGSRSIYTVTFSARYRMTTSRSGCYLVNLRSDDGIRLSVDGVTIFNRWVDQAPTIYQNILLPLANGSQLVLEYYENGGQNIAEFYNLREITNTLTTNITQTRCSNDSFNPISGTVSPLPTGITLSNWQWYYSTSPTGAGTPITGATSENYTPSGAPFNASGTYYVYRTVNVNSSNAANQNNWGATNPVVCTIESNRSVITVNSIAATVSLLSANNECPELIETQGFNPQSGSYDSGSTLVRFRVSVDQSPTSAWSFSYSLTGATLRTGLSNPPVIPYYTSTTGNVNVPAGSNSIDLTFYVNNNPPVELNSTLSVSNVSNSTCADADPHSANIIIKAMPDVGDYE